MNKVVGESILRNEEAYKQQKLFVGNASHEMQTPLAVCSNRLEMLLEEGNLSEHQMEERYIEGLENEQKAQEET